MPGSAWALLSRYLKPYKGQVAGLWLLLVGGLAAQLINPQIIRRFLDGAESGEPLNLLLNRCEVMQQLWQGEP